MARSWYTKVTADPNDLSPLADALDFFEAEYQDAQKDLAAKGRVEEIAQKLPALAEYRFAQWKELKAIYNYLDIKQTKAHHDAQKRYMEHYNRQLTERTAEKYAEADDEVLTLALLKNQVELMMEKFVGISKGLEYLHFQLSNITKLRVAGIEDAYI